MGCDKLWLDLGGRPLVAVTLAAAAAAGIVDRVVIAAPRSAWDRLLAVVETPFHDVAVHLIEGGERRQDTVRLAVQACGDAEIVCMHDAARPLCPPHLFRDVVEAARRSGAATAALPLVDSIKRTGEDGVVVETLDRRGLVAVQTPQAFRGDVIAHAHGLAAERGWQADDDCALVELAGGRVVIVPGDPRNLKVTTPADMDVARRLVAADAPA